MVKPLSTDRDRVACRQADRQQDLRIRPPNPPNLGGTGFTLPKVGESGGQNDGFCVSPDQATRSTSEAIPQKGTSLQPIAEATR